MFGVVKPESPRNARLVFALALFALANIEGQGERATFEAASIRPTGLAGTRPIAGVRVRGGCYGGPGSRDPGLFHCGEITGPALVGWAYHLQRHEILYPKSLGDLKFEIMAKVPEGARKEEIPLMLQKLLSERFKLRFHMEERQVGGYELIVAKGGPKMPKTGDAEADGGALPGLTQTTPEGWLWWNASKRSVGGLANFLSSRLEQPVMDVTGLAGVYDFTLTWAPLAAPAASPQDLKSGTSVAQSDGSGPTIFEAVQKLGLRLVPAKVSAKFLVVDHVEGTPTEN